MACKEVRWVKLGEFIKQRREKYKGQNVPVFGVNRDGLCSPKQKNNSMETNNMFYYNDFVFNPYRMEINSIYISKVPIATCSHLYEVFFIDDNTDISPDYVLIFMKRDEFRRVCDYVQRGTSREYCGVKELSEIAIPLPYLDGRPDLAEQQRIVDAWQGLRQMKEQNEQMVEPLMQLCRSAIVKFKSQYPMVALGGDGEHDGFIEACDERNSDNRYTLENLRGLSIQKTFMPTKAKMDGVSLTSYKVVKPDEFCYVTITSRNSDKITLALNDSTDNYIVSSSYEVFRVKDHDKLYPAYLMLLFCRPEFDRYARFNSWGSAREAFSWEEMKRVRIPLPPIDVQRSIVAIYQCAQKAKQIAEEADRLSKEVCPALIQHMIHEYK